MEVSPRRLLKLIKNRRTVRRFDPNKRVRAESLRRILEAGTWAPYAPYHPQGWKFIALRGAQRDAAAAILGRTRTVLKFIRMAYAAAAPSGVGVSAEEHRWKDAAKEFHRNLGNAPVMIVAIVPTDATTTIRGHNLASAWTAAQNMMLQAQAEDLATGVVTFQSRSVHDALLRHVGVAPTKWIVAFVLNVGHALETPQAVPRRKQLYEVRG